MGDQNDLVSTKEAANLLGYTVQHTRLLIREGKLDARKLGRDWLLVREKVEAYRAGRSDDMGSPPESSE